MIIFRTECGERQGWGHLMRCMAISEAAAALGEPTSFVISGSVDQARALLGAGPSVQGAAAGWEVQAARSADAVTVVLDGYGFDEADAMRIVQAGARLAVMDDDGQGPVSCADVVVNGNLHYADPSLYRSAPKAKLLLGCDFAPLRPALHRYRMEGPVRPVVTRAIVIPGGSDVGGLLVPAVDALLEATLPGVEIMLAAEQSDPGPGERANAKGRQLAWLRKPLEVAAAMASSDIAIAAGGMSSYELAFFGVPSLLVPASAMQAPVSADIERAGAARLMPPGDLLPALVAAVRSLERPDVRQPMHDAGRRLFDGRGAERIARALMGDRT